jgi:hypothetical protein
MKFENEFSKEILQFLNDLIGHDEYKSVKLGISMNHFQHFQAIFLQYVHLSKIDQDYVLKAFVLCENVIQRLFIAVRVNQISQVKMKADS